MHARKLPLVPFAVALAVALAAPAVTHAQQKYPSKPVRIILPFTAGSAVDTLARIYADEMAKGWAQTVLVDNRPGANGIIGMEAIAKSPPDGYTLGMGNIATLAINPSLYAKLPYEPARDYAPISFTAAITNCLIVHPSLPARSIKELIALAKSRPNQINYASGGIGSAQHIPMELLRSMSDISIVHVAYKGLTPAFNDVVAGHVPMMISGLVTAIPHHKAGRVRILGTTGTKRSAAAPDIPAIAETIPGYEGDSWTGFFAPAGVSGDIVTRVHLELSRIGQMPATRDRLSALGLEVVSSTPEVFADVIRKDTARLGKVIRAANIRAE